VTDDFDRWWPRARWRTADVIVWVTDSRFGPTPSLRSHDLLRSHEVRIERAGRIIRTFTVSVLIRSALARLP
jgi:hypothetical protein